MSPPAQAAIGIIGTGFGGIGVALELQRRGIDDVLLFERAEALGGVWRENIYPGCACDIPSHLYCFEAHPNPGWSATYPPQAEILDYLRGVARRSGLDARIRFGWEVTRLRFLAARGLWELQRQDGALAHVRMVVLALGPQSRPTQPDIPGAASFAGTALHSARWDPGVSLAGRHVAILGTGASAVQILPRAAEQAASVTLFQRSAPWILPRGARALSRFERALFRRVPATQAGLRAWSYWLREFVGLGFLRARPIGAALAGIAHVKRWREVRDPVLRRALTPDHRIGCKRTLVSDDFYPAMAQPHVRLVTSPIERILPDGLRTADGAAHAADVLVYATGFNVADADGYLRVEGLEGRVLADEWAARGPQAYLGCAVAGYPNLAMVLGPNSGLGHSSAVHVIESQARWIAQYATAALALGAHAWLDLRAEEQERYNHDLQRRLAGTAWASGCRSWYLSRSGRNTTIFPGVTHAYRRLTAVFDPAPFRRGEALRAPAALADTAP